MVIKVYDWQGNEQDLAYLRGKYGAFVIQQAAEGEGPVYKITTLREKVYTSASLVVFLKDEAGTPLDGVEVAWYWPDAPDDANAGPLGGVLPQMAPNRCVHGKTNETGEVGFGMGHGAYYWPGQGQIGPHAAWMYGTQTRSDLILGLGMLGGTNHDHFDVEFALFEEDPGPDPEPEPEPEPEPDECPWEEIEEELDKIEAAIGVLRAQVEAELGKIIDSLGAIRDLRE
jgi:hypothetical protein